MKLTAAPEELQAGINIGCLISKGFLGIQQSAGPKLMCNSINGAYPALSEPTFVKLVRRPDPNSLSK
jgi:hypothetical protein